MPITPLPGVFNQGKYPGTGDSDECWVVGHLWGLVAAGHMVRAALPTVYAFRAVAGVPDGPGPTGGTSEQARRALVQMLPAVHAAPFAGTYDAFHAKVATGAVAVIGVKASLLPPSLDFGFGGAHTIAVVDAEARLYVADSLAAEGSRPVLIEGSDFAAFLRAAQQFGGDGKIHGNIIPMKPADTTAAKLRVQLTAATAKIAAARKALA